MLKVNLTKQELNNLLAFLTGKSRVQITGDEAFEFVNIVNKLVSAEEIKEEIKDVVKEVVLEEEGE